MKQRTIITDKRAVSSVQSLRRQTILTVPRQPLQFKASEQSNFTLLPVQTTSNFVRFVENITVSRILTQPLPEDLEQLTQASEYTDLFSARSIRKSQSGTQTQSITAPTASPSREVQGGNGKLGSAASVRAANRRSILDTSIISQIAHRNNESMQMLQDKTLKQATGVSLSNVSEAGLSQSNSTHINQLQSSLWNSRRLEITPISHPIAFSQRFQRYKVGHTPIPIPTSSEPRQSNSILHRLHNMNEIIDDRQHLMVKPATRQTYELKMEKDPPSLPVYTFNYDLKLNV